MEMDRKRVLMNLKGYDAWEHTNYKLVKAEADVIIEALENERPKGKWEYDADKDKSGGHCNRCGHFLRYGEKTNFCPDCGADMREEV